MSGKNVPALRFPEFEGDWDEVRFGQIASIANGQVDPKKDPYASMPHIAPDNIQSGTGALQEVRTARECGVISGKYEFDENAIVYSKIRPNLNKVAKPGFAGICSADMYPLWPVERKSSAPFLLQLMLDDRFVMAATAVSLRTGLPKINRPDLNAIRIFLPSITEQEKIAAFLGADDEKISGLEKKKALLEAYKRGVMQKLFSRALRFKDAQGRDFPDWEEKRLGDVFDWVRTNSLSRDRLTAGDGDVQNIHYGDIHTKFHANFRQAREDVPFIRDAKPTDFADTDFCQLGDVVIADASEDYADIGKAIEIVELSDVPLVAGLHTYIARPTNGSVVLGFAGYLLRSATMRQQIMRIAQGISVLGVSKRNLEKLTLELPHRDEQKKIAMFLSSIDTQIAAVGTEIAEAKIFKKGLLQQMFV